MKKIFRILSLSAIAALMFMSCGEEPYDVKDGGMAGANLYVTQEVKYFTGDGTFDIAIEKYEGEGVIISSIDYTVELSSALESVTASLSTPASAASISIAINDLLAAVSPSGTTLQESDLEPGDTFTFDFSITLSDGRSLDPPASTVVTVLCAPAPGDYVIAMHDSYGDGWQTDDGNGGSGLRVTLDDGTVFEVGMCSPYLASGFDCVDGDGYNASDVVSIPTGALSADWFFPGDYYGEISFEIYAPSGDVLFTYAEGDTYSGTLPIINCAN